jgi:hypothetical protein
LQGVAETNKTMPTDRDVTEFVTSIADEKRRTEAAHLIDVMSDVTGQPAVLWGPSIIGFGSLHLTYASGRELDYFRIGFAPRKAATTIYLNGGVANYQDLLPRLGKHSSGKGCLYLKNVEDAEPDALRELTERSYRWTPEADS